MELTRNKIIILSNVMENIVEDKENLFSAEFKIRLIKNQENFKNEFESLHKVLIDKLDFVKKGFEKINEECCKKDKKGKFKLLNNMHTILFNCIRYDTYELKKTVTKKTYTSKINILFKKAENKFVMEELKTFLEEKVNIDIWKYNINICPDNIGIEFYKYLKDFIVMDQKGE